MRAVLLAVLAMYTIQGSLFGLSDSTFPQLLSRDESSLKASEVLAIVHLPAALKVFFAPFVDYGAQYIYGGYKTAVMLIQGVMVAAIYMLIPLLPEVLEKGGQLGAQQLRWPLFAVAMSNAVSDLALDAFALRQVPEESRHLPAVCQVLGIFMGMTIAKSGFFWLVSLQWPVLALLQGFVHLLALVSLLAVLAVGLAGQPDPNTSAGLDFVGMLRSFWVFLTHRHNMPHWLLYQFFMPAVNFHHAVVLPIRYEQFGLKPEAYAEYDLPLAVLTVVILVFASRVAEDATQPLSFVMKGYFLESLVVLSLLLQYCSWSGSAPSQTFIITYVVLCKLHDLLFFIVDMMEFAFMGRVASLDSGLVATLVTMQASAFNFSEFFYCWLSPTLVDRYSSCSMTEKVFSCTYDAYPLIAAILSSVTLLFLVSQWSRIQSYQDVSACTGWTVQKPLLRHKLTVGMVLGGISLFTWTEVMQ